MLIFLLLVSVSTPDPLDKIRKGKDQESKTTRILAYGFAACRFAQQGNRYSYDANRLRTPDAHERAQFFWTAMRKAEKLAKRDTDKGIPCDGQYFGAMMECLMAARFPNDVAPCTEPAYALAIKLALADLPELVR
jgi:hypothetical protein